MDAIKKILVVDDENSMRRNISDLLSPLGYETLEAGDGETALQKFIQEKPHVVILDINIPKKDGLTVLKEIKAISNDIPVIIFTAFGTSERAIKAMKLGAFDYLEKPFELDEFILIVERAYEYFKLLTEVKNLRSIVNETVLQIPKDNIIRQKSQDAGDF